MSEPRRAIPIVLDCDPGHDDALAILLAATHRALSLRAITTVAGSGGIRAVTHNARAVATLAGIAGVPLAAGAAAPISGQPVTAERVYGDSGLDGPELPRPAVPPSDLGAPELLARALAAGPVTIVATGPLTNIATLLREQPDLAAGIERIAFTGGATGRGDWSPLAEFNVLADPEAADVVLRSGVPVTMCCLDLAQQAPADAEVIKRFRGLRTPLGETCAQWLERYAGGYEATFGAAEPPLSAPLAVIAAAAPALLKGARTNVVVETRGAHTRGATVVDLQEVTGRAPNVELALRLDTAKFWDLLIGAVAVLSG
jgi:purine nucleosidase/pyrimidine-specific ribonucleoside hydrolase